MNYRVLLSLPWIALVWAQIAGADDISMPINGQCDEDYLPFDNLCLSKAAVGQLTASEMARKIYEFEAAHRKKLISNATEIVQETVGLWLTEDMHSKFWSSLREAEPDPQNRIQTIAGLKDTFGKMLPWQTAMYESFLLSFRSGEVVWTEEYLEQADYWGRLNSRQIEESEAMNVAAATKQPFLSENGAVAITEELILSSLNNLKVGQYRLDRLIAEEWNPAPSIFEYPNLGLNLLWDEPWPSFNEVLTVDGVEFVNQLINLEKPNGDFWQITITKYPTAARTPLQNQRRTLEGTGEALGVNELLQFEEDWRGLESSILTGTFAYEGAPYSIKISATYIPGLQAMMQKMVFSAEAATTQVEFERLAGAVVFTDKSYAASSTLENDANSIQFNEKLKKVEKEARESGVPDDAVQDLLSGLSGVAELPEMEKLKAAYGELLTLSDREIAVELSFDPSKKARIGLAEVELIKAATEFPIYLDEFTSYTGVHYDIDSGSVVYHYTMTSDITETIMSMSSSEQTEFQQAIEDTNPNAVCELSLELLSRGFDMTFSYRNTSGKQLFSVIRTYADCSAQGY